MAKKKLFTREFFIGAIGITALLVIYFLINFFKGIDLFKVGETYYVRFSDVSQLVGSSPVYLNGYKAGNVRSINCDFNQIDNIIVEIEIDKRIKIPKGSTARITTHMLGGADLGIILSNSNEILAPGDTITGTLDKGIAGEAADKIMPAFNSIMPKIDSVLTSLNTILANPALTASINNVEQMSGELATATASLNALLSNDVPQITGRMIEIEDDMLAVSSQLSEVDYKQLITSIESTL
ncbi:MAG: MCE family protein, partial [Bacteroidaceae bacterium]|nr:MCE family protein [Bacteroidaceae bacterium]